MKGLLGPWRDTETAERVDSAGTFASSFLRCGGPRSPPAPGLAPRVYPPGSGPGSPAQPAVPSGSPAGKKKVYLKQCYGSGSGIRCFFDP
jgi:hypothetical protein